MIPIPFLSPVADPTLSLSSNSVLPHTVIHRPKHRVPSISTTYLSLLLCLSCFYLIHTAGISINLFRPVQKLLHRTYLGFTTFDWKATASFRITEAMRVSIGMNMALGVVLGVGVGLISGLEPAVVIGVSASMAMGCVFVISFAILHGVNALRAVSFAVYVSVCLPFGFGIGFGIGVLIGVFLGLEDPDDIREKTRDFILNFGDFVRVVAAFSLEIL